MRETRVSLASMLLGVGVAFALAIVLGIAAYSLGDAAARNARSDLAAAKSTAFQQGYTAGLTKGRQAGASTGHKKGYAAGRKAGIKAGRHVGTVMGQRLGFARGRTAGTP